MIKSLKYFLFIITLLFISSSLNLGNQENYPDILYFKETINAQQNISYPKIYSREGIVMDKTTGRILYEKNARVMMPMASTTKIMTAILAIEKSKTDDIVSVSKRAARVNGSTIGLMEGEKYKLIDLLYGLMLNSGNDAAIAIAEHVGGSVENFAKMMTAKAKEIGAVNTNFITPHGLDNYEHYSTAYDLALMARYALNNKLFAKIVSTKQITIGNGRSFYNTNEMLSSYPGADGVKTGYTGKAGRCLVTSITNNGWQLISVILGSGSRYQRQKESTSMLNYTFDNYSQVDLNMLMPVTQKINVLKGKTSSIDVTINNQLLFPLNNEEIKYLRVECSFPKEIKAPLYKGTYLGKVKYISLGNELKSVDVFFNSDINKKSVIDFCSDLLNEWAKNIRYSVSSSIIGFI